MELDILREKAAELEKPFRDATGLSRSRRTTLGATPLPLLCRGEGRPSSPPKSWRHLLDVATDDVLRHDANEIFARLEAAKWLGS